jgi:hypothetical protein
LISYPKLKILQRQKIRIRVKTLGVHEHYSDILAGQGAIGALANHIINELGNFAMCEVW